MLREPLLDIGNVARIRLGERRPLDRVLKGRKQIHANISFDIADVETRCRLRLRNFLDLVFRHRIEAHRIVIGRLHHIDGAAHFLKTELRLRFGENNGNVALRQLVPHEIRHIGIAEKIFPLREDAADFPAARIHGAQKFIHMRLRRMRHIVGTEQDVETGIRRLFDARRQKSHIHRKEIHPIRIDFQRRFPARRKFPHIFRAKAKFYIFDKIGIYLGAIRHRRRLHIRPFRSDLRHIRIFRGKFGTVHDDDIPAPQNFLAGLVIKCHRRNPTLAEQIKHFLPRLPFERRRNHHLVVIVHHFHRGVSLFDFITFVRQKSRDEKAHRGDEKKNPDKYILMTRHEMFFSSHVEINDEMRNVREAEIKIVAKRLLPSILFTQFSILFFRCTEFCARSNGRT